jgi:TonB family protein
MERETNRKASAGIPVDPVGTTNAVVWPDENGQDDLAHFCLERDTAETKRELAWVNALCFAFLLVGLMGVNPPPITIIKRPPNAEEAAPVVIEPLVAAVQQVSPDSTAEEPPSERPSEESAGVAVVADSPAVAFSVPTVGNVLVPLNMAQAPPANPMQPAVSLSTPHIEQIASTGMTGSRPAPPYPTDSLMRREQGTVLLLMQVDESGKIVSISVKDSSGYPGLDKATLEYVRKHWFFSPGQGTRWFESPIVFQLR